MSTRDICYVNPKVAEVQLPSYSGQRTRDMTPDTLDLAEMAGLAINGMTEPTDPDSDYEVYWRVHFKYNPPMMFHTVSDTGIRSKFHTALPLMRLMSGSSQNLHVEECWLEVAEKERSPQGVLVTPLIGRPWGRPGEVEQGAGFVDSSLSIADHLVEPQHNGYSAAIASEYYVLTGYDRYRRLAEGIVDGLREGMVENGDEAFFPRCMYEPYYKVEAERPGPTGITASFAAWAAFGMNICWHFLGYERARDLAGKLLRYIVRRGEYFAPDGSFLLDLPEVPPEHVRYGVTHFHAHTMVILHSLHHALMTGDQELLDFAVKAYAKAKSHGETTVGWFPERVTGPLFPQAAELCCVADMIMVAAYLASAGLDDSSWDDVDRWVRNQFAEGQLRHCDWIGRLATGMPPSLPRDYSTSDRVPERNIGAFSGWADVNEWSFFQKERAHMRGIQHCCTGNSARALYVVWNKMLDYKSGKLRINLLLNRTSPWADIDSHIPYTGQVDVKIKETIDISIRIPEWVMPGQVRVEVNGNERRISSHGRYADLGNVKRGDMVILHFPIEDRESVMHIEKRRYVAVRRGNTVVAIDPPGTVCPIYQREHYRANGTRWKNTERFLPEKTLSW